MVNNTPINGDDLRLCSNVFASSFILNYIKTLTQCIQSMPCFSIVSTLTWPHYYLYVRGNPHVTRVTFWYIRLIINFTLRKPCRRYDLLCYHSTLIVRNVITIPSYLLCAHGKECAANSYWILLIRRTFDSYFKQTKRNMVKPHTLLIFEMDLWDGFSYGMRPLNVT